MQWDFSVVLKNLPFLLTGVEYTVMLTLIAMVGGMVLGLFIALARMSRFKVLSFPAQLYIDFFRSTPLLIQLVWFYYCLPIVLGINMTAFVSGAVAMTIYASAYISEIYRAGIEAVPTGQWEAAMSQGMTNSQILRRVVLPQAVRHVLPLFASQFMSLFKDSSIASVVSVTELMFHAAALVSTTFRPLEVYTVAAIIYVILTYPQSFAINLLHRRTSIV